jgi:hypothetical protein
LEFMNIQEAIRAFFFILFFFAGTAALGLSVLCEDMVQYYQNRQHIVLAKESIEKARILNEDYDALLSQLENDPNLVRRLAQATVGTAINEPNTAYPRPTQNELIAAREALTGPDEQSQEPQLPRWLARSIEPQKRKTLFLSGIALILISFVCFRPGHSK